MAPRIELLLPGAGAEIAGGQTIEGTVRITTDEVIRIRRANVALQAHFVPVRADVDAHHEAGAVATAVVCEGEPEPTRGVREFPFRLDVPSTLHDYTGRLFRMRFQLQVGLRADERQMVQVPVTIAPRPVPGVHVAWDAEALADTHANLRGGMIGLIIGALALAAATAIESTLVLGFGFVAVALGLITVATNMKPWMAERRTGRLTLELSTPQPGVLRVGLRSRNHLEDARAELIVEEYARQAAPDRDNRVWRQALLQSAGALSGADGLQQVDLALPGPGQAPFPVEVGHRSSSPATAYAIDWRLRVHAALPGWPDWEREILLRARPSDVPFDEA